ncbi:hypothetical protein E2I00_005517 [Balaenoptera physalus]|uniref:MIP18 family-like domain-containing protein n=1 Tax=Balaenoptera physalus TaxID=9770 RepID=A0A643CDW1_BALPH|nr:hypothetical protein E2I00_005517 [Balaenoptera physalus]
MLEEQNFVQQLQVQVSNPEGTVAVAFTPIVLHCSIDTLIGQSTKVKLQPSIPQRFRMDGHSTPEHATNKHLGDKEQLAAALENPPAGDCGL